MIRFLKMIFAKIRGTLTPCNRCKHCIHAHRILPQFKEKVAHYLTRDKQRIVEAYQMPNLRDGRSYWYLYCFEIMGKVPNCGELCESYVTNTAVIA